MTAPLDLDAISAEFLAQCGSCDAGILVICACADRDYRPTMLALVREVERLRAEMSGTADCAAEAAEVCGDADELRSALLNAFTRLRKAVNG